MILYVKSAFFVTLKYMSMKQHVVCPRYLQTEIWDINTEGIKIDIWDNRIRTDVQGLKTQNKLLVIQ